MGFLNRLAQLLTHSDGRFSTTDAVSLIALVVSSIALLLCVVMDRDAATSLGLYLGAWVTHAGVQVHQKMKSHVGTHSENVPGGKNGQHNFVSAGERNES